MNYETATLQVIFVIQKIAHLIDHLADHFNITHQTKPADHFGNDHFADHFAKIKQLRFSAAPIILVDDHFGGRKLYSKF